MSEETKCTDEIEIKPKAQFDRPKIHMTLTVNGQSLQVNTSNDEEGFSLEMELTFAGMVGPSPISKVLQKSSTARRLTEIAEEIEAETIKGGKKWVVE